MSVPGLWPPQTPKETKKRQRGNVGAAFEKFKPGLWAVENPKFAAGDVRSQFAAAEAQVGIGRVDRIVWQPRRVAVGKDRVGRQIIGPDRAVRREWGGHHLVNANASPRQRAVEAFNESYAVSGLGAIIKPGLLHGPLEFAQSRDLAHVAHTAAEFVFHIRAAARHRGSHCHGSKKGEGFSHRLFRFLNPPYRDLAACKAESSRFFSCRSQYQAIQTLISYSNSSGTAIN